MKRLIANYEISEKLHESAHSLLYRATQGPEHTPVILKVLKPDNPAQNELSQFQREFDITHALNTDGVIRALRIEEYQNTKMIVEEDIGAESLDALMAHRVFTLEECLFLAMRTANILRQIHATGIVHKNINPSNIIWNSSTEQVKLIDFGIASRFPGENLTLKSPSLLEGSLPYISPEQTGRMNRFLDSRTDLYSLGITLYEMLTGRLPFETEDSIEMVYCHIAKQVRPPVQIQPNIPETISKITMKLLAKTAEDRYQSASGLEHDLYQCLGQLSETGTIESFPIGQRDFSGKLQISQKNYGRDQEIQSLLSALERASAGGTELVLVSGYSGIGKTTLVNEVHKPILEKRGFFITGKFEPYTRNIPYLAFAKAFESIVRQLLTEPDESLLEWKDRLAAALGTTGQLITDIVPDLELLIGIQPELELYPTERRNRLKLAFQNFIQVFTRKEHPLIIFLDDLQWIDFASLELLKDILTEPSNSFLLIIGAYRDNEVPPDHPLIKTIGEIKEEKASILELSLGPLSKHQTDMFLTDTFNANQAEIEPIGSLLQEKTGGNPFFLNQFLKTLYESQLVKFDNDSLNWTWNINQIIAQNITDNVAELMIGRLQLLPKASQQVLRLAACIGDRFDLNTLSIISEQEPTEVLYNLKGVIEPGFILPLDEENKPLSENSSPTMVNSGYKFLHDNVQQAAYDSIEDEDKEEIHVAIGRLLLKNFSPKEREENIFHLVKHLNNGSVLLSENEKFQLIDLNLAAALKAKESTAYESSLQYLSKGMALLPEDSWETLHALTCNLYKNRVEIEHLNNNFSESEKFIRIALKKVTSAIEKAEFFNLQIVLNTMLAKYELAVNAGKTALSLLDIGLTEDDSPNKLIPEIDTNVGSEIGELIDNKEMTNRRMHTAIKIMANMLPLTFLSDPGLYRKIASKSTITSIVYGHAPESSICYSGFGILLVSLGRYQAGYEFGTLALKISEKYNNYSQRCKAAEVLIAHLSHWVNPMRDFQNIADIAYQAANESGEVQFAGYTMKYAVGNHLFMGTPLPLLQQKTLDFAKFCTKTHNQAASDVLRGQLISTSTLMDAAPDEVARKSNAKQEKLFIQECHENQSPMALCVYNTLKCQSLCILGQYNSSNKYALEAESLLYSAPGSIIQATHNFYSSLSLIAMLPDASKEEQISYMKQVGSNQSLLKTWVDNCEANFLNMYCLVEAEIARIGGNDLKAMDLYDQSIASSHKEGFVQNEAIANELAGKFWIEKGKNDFAGLYLKKAHSGFTDWGAKRKTEALEIEYPQYFSSAIKENVSESLDLNSILKASQAISEEIDQKSLLSRIMKIMIENAGAQKGVLVLNQENQLIIKAKASSSDTVEILPFQQIEESTELPRTLVRYVYRTGEYVVFHEAQKDDKFAMDAYMVDNQPQSVLCLPVRYQDSISGVLYLENNTVKNTFAQARITLLTHLLTQAAISLENARLFEETKKGASELREEVAVRRRVEEKLRDSEKQFKGVFEQAAVGVARVAPDGTWLAVNRKLCSIVGYSREELLFKTFQDITHPNDLQTDLEYVNQLVRNEIETYSMEKRYLHKNGGSVWINLTASLVRDINGNPDYFIAIIEDITERKLAQDQLAESENNLLITLNSIGDAVIATDKHGRITRINPVAQALTGWDYNEAKGKELSTVFHIVNANSREVSKSPVEKIIARGEIVGLANHTILRSRDGSEKQISDSGAPIRNHEGEIIGIVLVFRDVTERYKLEEQVYQSDKMQAIGQLAGGIAHDFNNQLAAILGYADLLVDDLKDEQQLKHANNIMDGASRAAELTAQLLAFSHKGKFLSEPVSVHNAIADVADILKHSVDKRITIKQHLNASTETTMGDPTQLQNAILNIAINARDAMPNGGQLIFETAVDELDTSFLEHHPLDIPPGTYVVIGISDTGCGMSVETVKHIFEPFYTTKGVGKGTGMGLASVYGTVHNHKGALKVYSEPGKGSTFRIYLPLIEATLPKDRAENCRKPVRGSARILLVDDEEMVRCFASQTLERLGYQVTTCNNGKEAVDYFEKSWREIDLVLLDMIMPEMGGRETFAHLKKINPKVRVVLSSGYSIDGEAQTILDEGVMAFIGKPFGKIDLSKKVAQVLRDEND